jgi:hypothetical protein
MALVLEEKNAVLGQLVWILQKYNMQPVQVHLTQLMCIPD